MDSHRLANRYQGAYAEKYEAERIHSEIWQREQAAVEALLSYLEPGSTLLDIPVGTGRFGKLYARYGIRATGIDSSPAMLAQAQRKGLQIDLWVGDIRRIEASDRAFDASLCIRLFNWLDSSTLAQAFGELVRVSGRYVIFGVQHYLSPGELRLARLLRQWKRRFYMVRTRSEFVYHERREIQDLIQTHGLLLLQRVDVERRRDGVDYSIYIVRKPL
jgi:ubiquinone/menaquinone biosynthesis C-methylase UbiE